MILARILAIGIAIGTIAWGVWIGLSWPKDTRLGALPSGPAHPVQITDSTGAFSASVVDAGGGLGALLVMP